MSYPQGIDFRETVGFVTDSANCDFESGTVFGGNYPRTSAQGNTVGWEAAVSPRDRNAANDARLAGINFFATAGTGDYRFDLPAIGSYNVRLAMGDASNGQDAKCELFDTSSSLGVLSSGQTSGANVFKDATNTNLSAASWPASNTLVNATFTTTICRFRVGGGTSVSGSTCIAHAYVESAGGAAATFMPAAGGIAHPNEQVTM